MCDTRKRKLFQSALTLMTPTVMAYCPLGIVFGVLFTHAGYPGYAAVIMSALVYAGAVQFVALSMMTEQASLAAILFATAFVALRNSFYGLSFIARYQAVPVFKRFFLIVGLVDATYAALSNKGILKEDDEDFCFYVTLIPYLSWIMGTLIGALAADWVPELKGMDFILTAFFFTIVIECYLASKKWDALFIPAIASAWAYYLLPQYYLIIAMLSCCLYLYVKIRIQA